MRTRWRASFVELFSREVKLDMQLRRRDRGDDKQTRPIHFTLLRDIVSYAYPYIRSVMKIYFICSKLALDNRKTHQQL